MNIDKDCRDGQEPALSHFTDLTDVTQAFKDSAMISTFRHGFFWPALKKYRLPRKTLWT